MAVCAWVAVITAEPAPTTVTVPLAETVATAVLLELYEYVPELVELGGVSANGASP